MLRSYILWNRPVPAALSTQIKRSADADYGVVFSKAQLHRYSGWLPHIYYNGHTLLWPPSFPSSPTPSSSPGHGQKYQVSITDVEHNELIDILPRRDADWIIRYFLRYPKAERRRVRYVVMDMSALFRSVYKTMFPNATLIADRFHVQRLVLWAMERVRKDIQNTFPKTSPYLKHKKRILQKRGTTLSGEELVKLRCILSQSDELHIYSKKHFTKYWGRRLNWLRSGS